MKRLLITTGILTALVTACGSSSSDGTPAASPPSTPAVVSAPTHTSDPLAKALRPAEIGLACDDVNLAIHGIRLGDSAASVQRSLAMAVDGFRKAGAATAQFLTPLQTAEFGPSGAVGTLKGILHSCKTDFHYKP